MFTRFFQIYVLIRFCVSQSTTVLSVLSEEEDMQGQTVKIDSTDNWISLGSFGIGTDGWLRIRLDPGMDCDPENPPVLFVLTYSQIDRFWQDLFTVSDDPETIALTDFDRPAVFRKNFGKIDFKLTNADKPTMFVVGIGNPSIPVPAPAFKSQSGSWWDWFSEPVSAVTSGLPRRLQAAVNIDLRQSDGKYLETQFESLPPALEWVSLIALIGAGFYEVGLLSIWRTSFSLLHVFMAAVIGCAGLYLLLWSDGLKVSQDTGEFWSLRTRYIPELVGKVFDASEIAVYLLAALGWRIVRGTLTRAEWRFVGVVTGAMLYIGFFEIGCTSPASCSGYRLSRMIAASIAYLGVIIAINFHIAHLTNQISESSMTSGPSALGRLYQKHQMFTSYRSLFLFFLIQPSVALYFRMTLFTWSDDWVFFILYWMTRLSLLGSLAWIFRPRPKNMEIVQILMADQTRGGVS